MNGDKILKNIPYLEDEDLTDDGSIVAGAMIKLKNRPVLVMIQGNFCGWCTVAKPELQKLANEVGFACATIQIDGTESEKKAAAKANKAFPSPGVPTFLVYDRNGKFVKAHDGERKADALKATMSSI